MILDSGLLFGSTYNWSIQLTIVHGILNYCFWKINAIMRACCMSATDYRTKCSSSFFLVLFVVLLRFAVFYAFYVSKRVYFLFERLKTKQYVEHRLWCFHFTVLNFLPSCSAIHCQTRKTCIYYTQTKTRHTWIFFSFSVKNLVC